MLKELFDSGKCALGFHSGDWRYVSDQRCEQLQICSRWDNQSVKSFTTGKHGNT
jgi:hypothetical protein